MVFSRTLMLWMDEVSNLLIKRVSSLRKCFSSSLGRDEFINDGNVNEDGSMVEREPPIRVNMMTIEFR